MIMRMTAQMTFRVSAAFAILSLAMLLGCKHSAPPNAGLKATAQGTALVESSGGRQVGATGTALKDPLVVQVNDDQGTAVPGAVVEFHGPAGVSFDPGAVLTDSSGQATTTVTLGAISGRYQLTAVTPGKAKPVSLGIVETALDYEERLGAIMADKYCNRCHDSESSPERVSNYDNLAVKPHVPIIGRSGEHRNSKLETRNWKLEIRNSVSLRFSRVSLFVSRISFFDFRHSSNRRLETRGSVAEFPFSIFQFPFSILAIGNRQSKIVNHRGACSLMGTTLA